MSVRCVALTCLCDVVQTLGGVTVNFHPNSDAFIGAVAEKWIPWAHIGF